MFARLDRSRVVAILIAAVCMAVLALSFVLKPISVISSAEDAEDVVINITEDGFEPPLTSVQAGEMVTWVNTTNRPLTLNEGEEGQFFSAYLPAALSNARSRTAAPSGQSERLAPGNINGLFSEVIQPAASFSYRFAEVGDHPIYILEIPSIYSWITVLLAQGGQIRGHMVADMRRIDDSIPPDSELSKIYLPDISVYLRNQANQEVARVRTDLSGRFSLPHQKAGTYTLCWEAAGFQQGCSGAPIVIGSQSVNVGEFAINVLKGNSLAVVYGQVRFADSSLPRTFEPFANVNAFTQIRLHDGTKDLDIVYVNNFGDYLIPQAPVQADLWLEATTENELDEYGIAADTMPAGSAYRSDIRMLNHRPLLEPLEPTVGGDYARVAAPGGTVQLHAEATDPDGDAVSYRWILAATSGQLSSYSGGNVTWTLPNVEALHRIEVVAYDGRGGYSKSSVAVETTNEGVLFSGQIVNPANSGVPAADVDINGKAITTNANGFFYLHVPQANEYIMNVRKVGYALLSRVYLDGQTNGRWMLTPAKVVIVDPTKDIDVRDDKRVCPGAISQRILWGQYPEQNMPRYQDGNGEVVRVGTAAVDFEDLTVGAQYEVGDQFVDSGITMVGRPFYYSNGQSTEGGVASVSDNGSAGGTGNDLSVNNINVEFLLDAGVSALTVQYGEYGGNINLTINGERANVNDFGELDGRTIGGVAISVITNPTNPSLGDIQLNGNIDTFAIGGQELWIDDIVFDPIERLPRDLPCGPGMRVQIPANSLVDADGNPPPGMVQLSLGTYDILAPDGLPGDYLAEDSSGDPADMESFGAGAIEVSDGTNTYNLGGGMTAKLSLPVAAIHFEYDRPIPATVPNLVYNASTAMWEEIGQWTLNGSEYVTTVSHLSEFNADLVSVNPACIRIVSDTLPATYRLEVTIPRGTGSAPSVLSGVIDNSVPFHTVYRLPTNTNIILVAIHATQDIPIGTFVVNSGGVQDNPTDLRPDYPYNVCKSEVVLYDPLLTDPPSLSQPVANSFLHGLYSFYATSFDEFTGSTPLTSTTATAFAQATADYYNIVDPHDLRDTLSGFISTNNFAAGETHAVYANSADLGFGRDMHCTRDEVTPGVFDVACYVSNFGTGYENYQDGGGYGSPDATDFETAINQYVNPGDNINPVATVAMEYTRIEDPNNVSAFLSSQRVVKFYVYGATGNRVDGTNNVGAVDVNNAFVDLDGFGGRPLPQLCIVCHGGSINYSGAPSPTNPPVFSSFGDVEMGSVFLPFDLNSFTFNDAVAVGPLAQFTKANQQAEFRDLNQEMVLETNPGGPIEEVIDYMYLPLGGPGVGDQDQDFVVSGWDTDVAHRTMYRNVMTPACRACHVAQVNAVGPTFATAAEAVTRAASIRQRVCIDGVMPHARATYDRFWLSISPHQPSQLISWGTVYASALDWAICATAAPANAPPIPDVVYHNPTVQTIWDNRCIGCHPPNAALNLNAGTAFSQLVNADAIQVAGTSFDRVEAFSLNNSYLWHKLQDTQGSVGGSGVQMPQGGSLTPTERTTIQQWIQQGAAEEE